MKNTKFIFMFCISFLVSAILLGQTNIYVAANGNDSNSGTINAPLKTLLGARNKVRNIISGGVPSGGVVVNFRAGTYPVTSTVEFTSSDGGASGKPIIYTSYNDEKVIFDGIKFVNPGGFVQATNTGQLHNNANSNVYVTTITDNNLIPLLEATTTEMSMNDIMLGVARWPNIGYGHINASTIVNSGEQTRTLGTPTNAVGANFKTLENNMNFAKWNAEIYRIKKAYIHGYVSADWYKEIIRIYNILIDGRFVLMDGSGYGIKNRGASPNRFFVKHMLCELDEAGEWYFDNNTNKLYLWPIAPIDADSKIGVWAGPMAINVTGANYLNFEKITIQHLGKGVNGDGGISIRTGDHVKVAGVTFKYIQSPLTAFNVYDATNSGALSCNFYDANGSRLYGGTTTSTSVTHGRNYIENCHFTTIYSKDFYGGAAGIAGAGNIFKNNLVHNSNGQPITHKGVDHSITLNEVFNVGIEEGDGGAIYTGNDVSSFGNVIKHNFVHHIMSVPGLLGRASFFSDDYDAGETVEENVLYKGGWEAIKMNKGGGHTIIKNIIMEAYTAVRNGDGGTSYYNSCMEYLTSTNGKTPTSGDKTNYLGRMLQKVGTPGWQTGLSEANWNTRIEPFWISRYAFFGYLMNQYAGNNAMNAFQTRIYDNMYYGNVGNNNVGGTAAVLRNQTVSYSQFENPDNLNFKFKSPRPSFAPDIPFQNMGLYKDQYRCAVPNKDTYRRNIKNRFNGQACHTGDPYNYQTINARLYYNTGKMVTDLVPCENDGGGSTGGQSPYGGTVRTIPGTIEAEHYDLGGENVAYHDNDAINHGGAFRPSEGVDLASNHDGGVVVGWTNTGEWMEYTVNATGGTYTLEARVASIYSGKRVFVIIDGTTHTINVPNTTSWSTYQTVTLNNIPVTAGNGKVIRIQFPDGGLNLNWIKFTATSGGLPSPWVNDDIGSVAATGSATYASSVFTVKGSGADIWNGADEFHFVHQSQSGDKSISAKVESLSNTNSWAKAGVMFRDNTNANAKFVMVIARPDKQIFMQWRTTTGGNAGYNGTALGGTSAAKYVKVERVGNQFTGYYSTDGNNYTAIQTVTCDMVSSPKIGMAVTSHNDGTLCTAEFASVTIQNAGSSAMNSTLTELNSDIPMTGSPLKSATGISNTTLGSEITLYPNPAGSMLYVTLTGEIYDGTMLHIYSTAGSRITSIHITDKLNEVDVSGYSKGIYMMQIVNGESISTHKFIKE